jgi:hypothetical protein
MFIVFVVDAEVVSSETLVNFCQNKRHEIPEEIDLFHFYISPTLAYTNQGIKNLCKVEFNFFNL